jgi:Zn-finger nucleic acid-binding protein
VSRVWLDRGELDKIIDRSTSDSGGFSAQQQAAPPAERYSDRNQQSYPYKKKKSSFLGELFDFD